MRDEILEEGGVDRTFFLQAAAVAIGSFAVGTFRGGGRAPPPPQ